MGTNPDLLGIPFGKYHLLERLGRGGMAEVWKAKALGPHGYARKLVVKRVLPALLGDQECTRMFVEEARLSGVAQPPQHRADTILSTLKESGAAPSVGLAAFVAREVCRALGYAHALTDEDGTPLLVIHRDVSPSNVMVGFDGSVKLLDFGIAKALSRASENRTQAGVLKGKFGYMAPEQVECDGGIDHRADLFVVGILLWEMLTLRRLFKGPSDVSTMALVRAARVEPPSRLNPAVPPELDAICMRALARSRDQRWPDCVQMAAALDEVVHAQKFGGDHTARMMGALFPEAREPTHQVTVSPPPSAPLTPPRPAASELEAVPTAITMEPSEPAPKPPPPAAATRKLRTIAVERPAEPTARGHHRSGARRMVVVASMAVLAAGAAVLSSQRAPTALASGTAPVATPVQPATPPPSEHVTVRLTTRPPGAEVTIDGEAAGTTPLVLTLKRGTAKRSVILTAPGYPPMHEQLVPDVDSRLHFDLERPVPAPPPPRGRKPRRATTYPSRA